MRSIFDSKITCSTMLAILLLVPSVVLAQLAYSGDVATTKAFMADLASLYELRGKGKITLQLASSSDAIKQAAAGEIDLGGSARAARMDDRLERRAAVYPIVWDALVVIVNRETPIAQISLLQFYQLYSGQVTNWSDLGGADQPIELFAHRDGNEGIDHSLKELLLGDANATINASRNFTQTQDLERAVEVTPGSLAVTTYSSARKLKVRILGLDGTSPSIQSIRSGDYLFYFPLYLALREDGRNRREVREFLRFANGGDAKRVLRRNGVLPYTDGLSLGSRQLERSGVLERLRAEAGSASGAP